MDCFDVQPSLKLIGESDFLPSNAFLCPTSSFLPPMVNFTNILRKRNFFCTKDYGGDFLYLHFRFVLFWRKNIGAKIGLRMSVKLTPN
jgi:hypothetical protein